MSPSRDDIVMRPKLEPRRLGTPERAKEERRLAGAKRKRGVLKKLIRYKYINKARLKTARALRAAKSAATRAGGRSAAGIVGRTASRTPWGLLIMAGVVAAAVAVRTISGRSFENLGQQLNYVFLGDLDEQARAKMSVRQHFLGDRDLTAIIGQEGKVNAQMQAIHADLVRVGTQRELGRTEFMKDKDFQVDSTIELLIRRAINSLRHSMKTRSSEIEDKILKKAQQYIKRMKGGGHR